MKFAMYRDLREFIAQVGELGTLRKIDDADPRFEIGAVTEVAANLPECPALLFDRIKGAQSGFRIFTNATTSPQRAALALGVDPSLTPMEALKAWIVKRRGLQPRKPVFTKNVAFLENSDIGEHVDLGKFPVPVWHRRDGGPYIGTGSLIVTRDPDTEWVNASIYRVQIQSKNKVTIQFDHPGRHGAIIAQKYWDQGKPCPVAIVNGQDPALFIAGAESLPTGYSEYDFAGAIKDQPIEISHAPQTGLPVPAWSEFILEGHLVPPNEIMLEEGPFGEFTGYYASDRRPCPAMDVAAVHYRTNPILLASPPLKPPLQHIGIPFRAAGIWTALEAVGIPDIAGVWQHVSALMVVVALKQRYSGHAKRAGLVAAANAYMGRIVVVVDEDIDPSNLSDVMWAVATRAEPSESLDIIRDAWSSPLDPRISPQSRQTGVTSHSKVIINACRPFEWIDKFPATIALSPDEAQAALKKFHDALKKPTRT